MDKSLKDKSFEFPKSPGVYQMFDDQGTCLYIGKAKNLRQRLASYFLEEGDGRYQIRYLMRKVHQIETLITQNEKEALLLENTLIKKFQPRYNIFLKDDKSYLSIKLDLKHSYPSLSVTRHLKKDGALYFGPYTSAFKAREVADFIEQHFKMRNCSDHDFANRSRPCLQYQIKRCEAPCVNFISQERYQLMVQEVILFLQNKHRDLLKQVKVKMAQASQSEQFEEAARLRDLHRALEATLEKQNVVKHFSTDEDVLGWARSGDKISLILLIYREGILSGTRSFYFKTPAEDGEVLENFLLQYYSTAEKIPKSVYLPIALEGMTALCEILSDRKNKKVTLKSPERGEKHEKIQLAQKNAQEKLEQQLKNAQDIEETLIQMQKNFSLTRIPRRMECYDISNIQGKNPVASAVCFVDGKPEKKSYKKFKIKTVHQANDFAMMYEVLTRRLQRKDWPLPDLIVIDGGKGQLNSAHAAFKDLGVLNVDLISLAKEKEIGGDEKPERVFLLGRKDAIELKANSAEFGLLVRLRDEAHRFGVTFHRLLRGKSAIQSQLDTISGLGPSRKKSLIKYFGSIQKISEASIEEIGHISGISKALALRIYEAFRA